eukprot:4520415-Pleurochrysis_carterae.AAC.1
MARLSIAMHPPDTPHSVPTVGRVFVVSRSRFTAWRKLAAVGSAPCSLGSSNLASSNPPLIRASLLYAKTVHSSLSGATWTTCLFSTPTTPPAPSTPSSPMPSLTVGTWRMKDLYPTYSTWISCGM